MPSMVLGFLSGGTNILSGNYFSGLGAQHPVGGIQLAAHPNNSGIIYFGLSGGVTVGSGGFIQSGFPGVMDGIPISRGGGYFLPRLGFSLSGNPQVFVQPDASCSGQAVVSWEVF